MSVCVCVCVCVCGGGGGDGGGGELLQKGLYKLRNSTLLCINKIARATLSSCHYYPPNHVVINCGSVT